MLVLGPGLVAGAGAGAGGGQAAVVTLSCARAELLPAASRAETANVYGVPHARPVCADEAPVVVVICVPLRNTS